MPISHHQTQLLLPKDKFKSQNEAVNHAKSMGYSANLLKPSKTDQYYHFKQFTPKDGQAYYRQEAKHDSQQGKRYGNNIHPNSIPIAKVPADRLGMDGHGQHYANSNNHIYSMGLPIMHSRPAGSQVSQQNLNKQMMAQHRQLTVQNQESGLTQLRKNSKINY